MSLFDKVRQELDRAGQTAQRAIDEGRLRLELFRARQSVDRFAQRFGYATYRAKKVGAELPHDELNAHLSNLAAAEAEVTRLETLLDQAAKGRAGPVPQDPGAPNATSTSPPKSEPASEAPPSSL